MHNLSLFLNASVLYSHWTLPQCVTMCNLLQEEALEAKEVWEWSSTAAASSLRASPLPATSVRWSWSLPTLTARRQRSCKTKFYNSSSHADNDWKDKLRCCYFLMWKIDCVSLSWLIFAVPLLRIPGTRFAWTPRLPGWRTCSRGSCPSKYWFIGIGTLTPELKFNKMSEC